MYSAYRAGRTIKLGSSDMSYVAIVAPSIQKFVVLSLPPDVLILLFRVPAFNVVKMFRFCAENLLNTPKIPPCSSMSMCLFSWSPPVYPVYNPHVFLILPMLYVLPVIPAMIILDRLSSIAVFSNFVLLLDVCQFIQMLFNVALFVSPPFRPIVPSSLYSPYVGIVPYKSNGVVS